MAISVVLDLGQEVTLKDLKLFLSYAPSTMTDDQEIRILEDNGAAAYLEIPIPMSSFVNRHERQTAA